MTEKRVVVALAPGFEEIEAVTVIDVLRRAEVDVIIAGLDPGPVRGAHGITVIAEVDIEFLPEGKIDMIVLPGGMPGAEHLTHDQHVQTQIRRVLDHGGLVAAICAAPMAFGPSGLAALRTTTCYPGFEDRFEQAVQVENRVVIDGPVITSRGPGTALEFALELAALLTGAETADKLAAGMLTQRSGDVLRVAQA